MPDRTRVSCDGVSVEWVPMNQFHFEPDSYLETIRAEVPVYDELQEHVARWVSGPVERFVDLGAGTGRTGRAVLERFPDARVVLLDESPEMLEVATRELAPGRVERVIVGDLVRALPESRFDAVVSALAVHHLPSLGKQQLFNRVRRLLRDGGTFVLADVVVPDDPDDAVTPLSGDFDRPDRLDNQLTWLNDAGFDAFCPWVWKDLALFVAT